MRWEEGRKETEDEEGGERPAEKEEGEGGLKPAPGTGAAALWTEPSPAREALRLSTQLLIHSQ